MIKLEFNAGEEQLHDNRSSPAEGSILIEGLGSGCRAEAPISNTCFRFPAGAYLFEWQHARGIKAGAACVPAVQCTLPCIGHAAAKSTGTGGVGVAGTVAGATFSARFGRMPKNCLASAALFRSR